MDFCEDDQDIKNDIRVVRWCLNNRALIIELAKKKKQIEKYSSDQYAKKLGLARYPDDVPTLIH